MYGFSLIVSYNAFVVEIELDGEEPGVSMLHRVVTMSCPLLPLLVPAQVQRPPLPVEEDDDEETDEIIVAAGETPLGPAQGYILAAFV
jgi:hypothetical protein